MPSHRTTSRLIIAILMFTLLAALTACTAHDPIESDAGYTKDGKEFLIIAHRGASGYRPEHTIEAYQLAIEQGADFIEPDLVPTKDGVLIARHENALAVVKINTDGEIARNSSGDPVVLSATTDVAQRPEFRQLLQIRQIDGRAIAGWFSEDFTLAQIKTLYARERIPKLRPNNTSYTNLRIPTLEEILDLVALPSNRAVGIYPELKHPTHFRYGQRQTGAAAIGIDTAAILVRTLKERRYTDASRLYIQCFEVETLRRLKHKLLPAAGFSAPLVQLLGKLSWSIADVKHHLQIQTQKIPREEEADTGAHMRAIYGSMAPLLSQSPTYQTLAQNLPELAGDYVSGIGPRKVDARNLAKRANELNLQLHPYTIRAEEFFLSRLRGAIGGSVQQELNALRQMGATGVFIDQPDRAVSWRATEP